MRRSRLRSADSEPTLTIRVPLDDHAGEAPVPGLRELRILLDESASPLPSIVQQVEVAGEIREAETRHAVLLRPEQVSLPAEPQVFLGDPEAVRRRREGPQSLGRHVASMEGDTPALLGAAADAAPA